jgi:peptide-methionine (S)-S-oxide reductase
VKVYAEEFGGLDFISFNFYLTQSGHQLKPCEMPIEKVTQFIKCYAQQA